MGGILRCKLATHYEQIVVCEFVSNFLSYVSAKYYLNSFTASTVITKIRGGNFLLRHSVLSFAVDIRHFY